jgi:sugar phosphate isomerase/epimerase
MAPKIAIQLYTLRDLTKQDYEGVVRKVAAMGYDGVETAGFDGTSVAAAAKLFNELGLTVVGAHSPFPIGDAKNEILDTSAALGCKYMVVPHIGPKDTENMDAIKALCARANEAQTNAKARGMTLALHNHWWEYHLVEGKRAADWMVELLDPAILFELDTYWIKVGGSDPAERVREMGKRSPILHIKDGPANREAAQTAVGAGVMDFSAILKAGGANTEWWIMEADRVDGDALEAARLSCDYMKKLVR